MQVANLGKSGVSVGYFDTEEAAAHAYDRAAIGLLGRDNGSISTNFPLRHYQNDAVSCSYSKSCRDIPVYYSKWPCRTTESVMGNVMVQVPKLVGKTREEVKATLKSERAKVRRAFVVLGSSLPIMMVMVANHFYQVYESPCCGPVK